MLAIICISSMQNLILIIELLSKHIVQLEVGISPEPYDCVLEYLSLIGLIKTLIKFTLFSALHK